MTKKTKKITYPELRMGAKGDLVAQMQSLLVAAGSTVKTNGVFSIGTRAGVVKFQKKEGLEPTGVCNCETWNALLKYANIKEEKIEAPVNYTLEEKVDILWKEYNKKK